MIEYASPLDPLVIPSARCRRSRPHLAFKWEEKTAGRTNPSSERLVFSVDLDSDSYNLLARVVRTRIERGLYTAAMERAWRTLETAQPGPPWRLSMERDEAETLCEWCEKTYDIVHALGERWPDATRILDAVLRGWRAISMAIPYD